MALASAGLIERDAVGMLTMEPTGIPALAYGPGLLSVSHGPSEFVSVPRLVECAEVYARAAVRLLS